MASTAKLDENYNVLYLAVLGVVGYLVVKSIIKAKKAQTAQGLTPISDAIASIKTGAVKVKQVPDKIDS